MENKQLTFYFNSCIFSSLTYYEKKQQKYFAIGIHSVIPILTPSPQSAGGAAALQTNTRILTKSLHIQWLNRDTWYGRLFFYQLRKHGGYQFDMHICMYVCICMFVCMYVYMCYNYIIFHPFSSIIWLLSMCQNFCVYILVWLTKNFR